MNSFQKLIDLFALQSQNIDDSTQIHILSLNEDQFRYSIAKNNLVHDKKPKKNYRIQLKPSCQIYRQQIIYFIGKFQTKKLYINLDQMSLQQQIKPSLLKQVFFQQIKLFKEKQPGNTVKNYMSENYEYNLTMQKINKICCLKLRCEEVHIETDMVISDIFKLQEMIDKIQWEQETNSQLFQSSTFKNSEANQQNQNNNIKPKYKFCLNLLTCQKSQILDFIQFWCQLKNKFCQSQKQQGSSQNHFKRQIIFPPQKIKQLSLSSSKIPQNLLKKLKNQVIILQYENQDVLSLSSSQKYGYSINLGKALSDLESVQRIVKLILTSNYFISLEVDSNPDSLPDILSLVFKQYSHHSNYLIKIGNQVQLTSYRLMLNSNDIPSNSVYEILKLLQLPGHYELIFYGNIDYFQFLRLLFMRKPFIYFKYFLPLNQNVAEVNEIVTKMQNFAEKFKKKALQFCCILNDFTHLNFSSVESIFLSMHPQKLLDF